MIFTEKENDLTSELIFAKHCYNLINGFSL